MPMKKITAKYVAIAFVEHWVFKYGPPKTPVSDNGSNFVSKLFQRIYSYIGMEKMYTSTYYPQTNGQVERYNRTILDMLRNYVNEHQDDWDEYVTALKYAYNTSVHHSMGTTPFDLVLSHPPAGVTLHYDVGEPRYYSNSKKSREDYIRRLEMAILNGRDRLQKTQLRYKQDFDKRIRVDNRNILAGQYIYLDPKDGEKAHGKLGPIAEGPYRVLLNDKSLVYSVERSSNESIPTA